MSELYPQANKRKTQNLRSGRVQNPYVLDGVDCRSARGRKFRDIVDGIIKEFDPPNNSTVRELAGLRFTRDEMLEKIISGDCPARAHGDIVRLSNLIARLERGCRVALRARHSDSKAGPSLNDYLGHHAAVAKGRAE